jgi:hypothetical protein
MIANKLRSGSNQPTKEYTASGALANGDLVILNADNTVSVVEGTTVSDSLPSGSSYQVPVGSSYPLTWGNDRVNAKYDPNVPNRILASYRKKYQDNSRELVVTIGTVSGNVISWGSEQVAYYGRSDDHIADFDPATSGKVIVVFTQYSGASYPSQPKAVVGTISGTSISWGSITSIASERGYAFAAAIDTSGGGFVACWKEYPTDYGRVVSCSISGTTISAGSVVTHSSFNVGDSSIAYSKAPSSGTNYWMIMCNDGSSSYAGHYRKGYRSGTTTNLSSSGNPTSSQWSDIQIRGSQVVSGNFLITYRMSNAMYVRLITSYNSFGSQNQVHSSTIYNKTAEFDGVDASKAMLFYRQYSTNYSAVKKLTISGFTTSEGPEVVVRSVDGACAGHGDTNNTGKYTMAAYDRDIGSFATSGPNYVYGYTLQTSYTSENLTASNFIGISNGAYADTATATIQMNRATDNAQSGLTAGSTYYAQTDGTLSTTADSPSVSVGVARTTTSIKIKGSNA